MKRIILLAAAALSWWATPASAIVLAPPYDTYFLLASGVLDAANGTGGRLTQTFGSIDLANAGGIAVRLTVDSQALGTVLAADDTILNAAGESVGGGGFDSLQAPFQQTFISYSNFLEPGSYTVVLTTTLMSAGGSLPSAGFSLEVMAFPVPVPAALPLLAAALAGFGLIARRNGRLG